MRIAAALGALVLFLAGAAPAPPAMTFQGVGPAKLGMSERALARALGGKLSEPQDFEDQGCHQAPRDGGPPDLVYMIEDGLLTRIDVWAESPIKTDAGIGIGSTETEVRAAYGRLVRAEPDAYDDGQRWLTVQSLDRRGALYFMITN